MATPQPAFASTLPEFIFTVQNLSLDAESSSDSEEECSCCDEAASCSPGLGDHSHERSCKIKADLQDVLNSSGTQASDHASTTTSAPSLDLNISASSLSSYHLDWGLASSPYSSPSGVKRPRRQRLTASSLSSQASVTKHPEPPADHSDTMSEPSPRTDLKKLRPRRRSSQVVPPSTSPAVPLAVFASVSPADTVIHVAPSASHDSRMLLPAKQATLQPPASLSRVLARDCAPAPVSSRSLAERGSIRSSTPPRPPSPPAVAFQPVFTAQSDREASLFCTENISQPCALQPPAPAAAAATDAEPSMHQRLSVFQFRLREAFASAPTSPLSVDPSPYYDAFSDTLSQVLTHDGTEAAGPSLAVNTEFMQTPVPAFIDVPIGQTDDSAAAAPVNSATYGSISSQSQPRAVYASVSSNANVTASRIQGYQHVSGAHSIATMSSLRPPEVSLQEETRDMLLLKTELMQLRRRLELLEEASTAGAVATQDRRMSMRTVPAPVHPLQISRVSPRIVHASLGIVVNGLDWQDLEAELEAEAKVLSVLAATRHTGKRPTARVAHAEPCWQPEL